MALSRIDGAKRRQLLVALGLFALGAPIGYAQQAGRPWRVGFLGNSSAALEAGWVDAFREGMRSLGYTEASLSLEFRWAEGKNERLPDLAADLARSKVAVIVTGGTPGTLAGRKSGAGIPIVMVGVGDPVGAGLIGSLSRPGGTVTGIATLSRELEGKRLEFLSQLSRKPARVGVLMNPTNPFTPLAMAGMKPAAEALQLTLVPAEVRSVDDIDSAFRAIRSSNADAVILIADRFLLANRAKIVASALANSMPGIFPWAEFAQEGGLMSYGANYPDMYRRAANFVDRILKGTKPAEIPVEQPTKFELVINQRTARALSLKIPPSLLARADRVID